MDLDAGFRYDELSANTVAYNLAGAPILMDELKIGSIHILQLGINGVVTLNRDWFLKAKAELGTVVGGTYFETVIDFASDHTKARVRSGYSKDFSIGLGYLFPLAENLRIGPAGGWAYDSLNLTIHNAKEDGVPDPTLDGLSYNTRWRGPWAGVCTEYANGCMVLSLGYEYHWANWQAQWWLKGPDQPGGPFSENRSGNHAHGQVVFGKLLFDLQNGWDLSAGVNYQSWKMKDGEAKPRAGSFSAVGLPGTASEKVTSASWKPLLVTLGANYRF